MPVPTIFRNFYLISLCPLFGAPIFVLLWCFITSLPWCRLISFISIICCMITYKPVVGFLLGPYPSTKPKKSRYKRECSVRMRCYSPEPDRYTSVTGSGPPVVPGALGAAGAIEGHRPIWQASWRYSKALGTDGSLRSWRGSQAPMLSIRSGGSLEIGLGHFHK